MYRIILQNYSYIQSNTKLTHISIGIGFWAYATWDSLALSACNTFNNLYVK
jgi:hypothetical protein